MPHGRPCFQMTPWALPNWQERRNEHIAKI
jgi:hypothetical protein